MEFSDRRMELPKNHRFLLFDSMYVVDYIEEYLDNHTYAGCPLRDRFKCNFFVTSVSKNQDGLWVVIGKTREEASQQITYYAPKIMIASGTTSVPNVPVFENDGFGGKIYHSFDYGRHADPILSSPPKRIAVLGGGKSAADMAYNAAKSGHIVSWIIRKSGSGPGAFLIPSKMGKYDNPTEITMTRFAGTLSPSHFLKDNWWTWFLHRTAFGRWLLLRIYEFLEKEMSAGAGWGMRKGAKEGFEKLKPDARSVSLPYSLTVRIHCNSKLTQTVVSGLIQLLAWLSLRTFGKR